MGLDTEMNLAEGDFILISVDGKYRYKIYGIVGDVSNRKDGGPIPFIVARYEMDAIGVGASILMRGDIVALGDDAHFQKMDQCDIDSFLHLLNSDGYNYDEMGKALVPLVSWDSLLGGDCFEFPKAMPNGAIPTNPGGMRGIRRSMGASNDEFRCDRNLSSEECAVAAGENGEGMAPGVSIRKSQAVKLRAFPDLYLVELNARSIVLRTMFPNFGMDEFKEIAERDMIIRNFGQYVYDHRELLYIQCDVAADGGRLFLLARLIILITGEQYQKLPD